MDNAVAPMSRVQAAVFLHWRMNYPYQTVQRMLDYNYSLLDSLLKQFYGSGVLMSSVFTGTGASHAAFAFLFKAIASFYAKPPPLVHWMACDNSPSSLELLCACKTGNGGSFGIRHVMSDVFQFIPKDICTRGLKLHAARPWAERLPYPGPNAPGDE